MIDAIPNNGFQKSDLSDKSFGIGAKNQIVTLFSEKMSGLYV
jgi:hypothetical protein